MGKSLTFAIAACLFTAATALADVQVAMNNGRVSIVAKDATLRQILTEWARVGQTRVVNVDRIPGGPLTLELTNMPEGQALDVLLKSVSGYMAAPRPLPVAGLSVFDRIIVMPTAAAPRQAAAPPTPPADDDPDEPPANVDIRGQPRAPVFNTFPPPQVGAPPRQPGGGSVFVVPPVQGQQPAGAAGAFPGAPTAPGAGGVSVPGMIVQPSTPAPGSPNMSPSQPPPQPLQFPGQIQRPGGRGGSGGQ